WPLSNWKLLPKSRQAYPTAIFVSIRFGIRCAGIRASRKSSPRLRQSNRSFQRSEESAFHSNAPTTRAAVSAARSAALHAVAGMFMAIFEGELGDARFIELAQSFCDHAIILILS